MRRHTFIAYMRVSLAMPPPNSRFQMRSHKLNINKICLCYIKSEAVQRLSPFNRVLSDENKYISIYRKALYHNRATVWVDHIFLLTSFVFISYYI